MSDVWLKHSTYWGGVEIAKSMISNRHVTDCYIKENGNLDGDRLISDAVGISKEIYKKANPR